MTVMTSCCLFCGCRWSLWYHERDKTRTKEWKDNLKLVTSFDTVSLVVTGGGGGGRDGEGQVNVIVALRGILAWQGFIIILVLFSLTCSELNLWRWRISGRKFVQLCYSMKYFLHKYSMYDHIKPPSCISSGCDYMLFKVHTYIVWYHFPGCGVDCACRVSSWAVKNCRLIKYITEWDALKSAGFPNSTDTQANLPWSLWISLKKEEKEDC